ncbi:MAG: metallophosphoesterase [Opitutaceae bacterium]|nr:metallophosphoesterase [Opitutaceae bacterium]
MKFAVINDLHAQFAPKPKHAGYPGANGRAEWILRQFARGGAHDEVDFVIGAGDMIHGEDVPSIRAEMTALRQKLKQVAAPFHPCCGNHEISQQEGDVTFERPYTKAFGPGQFDYVIPAGPVEIIVLNNAGTFHVTAKRREERAERFEQMLRARPGVPKIMVCHVPLVPVRDAAVLRRSFGFISYRCLEGELLDLLDTHGADVRLVVSGHLHLTGMVRRRGVCHLVTAGTASFPHDYALINATKDRLRVEVRALPKTLREPASNIHGPPRYPKGYTDGEHLSPLSYLRGRPGERKFTIKL